MALRSSDGAPDVLQWLDHDRKFTSALGLPQEHQRQGSVYHKNTDAKAKRVNETAFQGIRLGLVAARFAGYFKLRDCLCPSGLHEEMDSLDGPHNPSQ